jgi:hypothetical protein
LQAGRYAFRLAGKVEVWMAQHFKAADKSGQIECRL